MEEIVIEHRVLPVLTLAVTLVLAAPVGAQESEANRAGKVAFNTSCRTCHSVKEGDNRLGPNLHKIIGREAGAADYGYSPAMAAFDREWDAKTLDRFIENPEAVVPGNNMKPYGGISDPEVRAQIVAYLSSVSGEGDEDDEGG